MIKPLMFYSTRYHSSVWGISLLTGYDNVLRLVYKVYRLRLYLGHKEIGIVFRRKYRK
jgi:hypothetical protein